MGSFSEFSEILRNDLPTVVFFSLDLPKSNATIELQEHLKWEDEDEEESEQKDTRKKDIDPYLLDYWGSKYKQQD